MIDALLVWPGRLWRVLATAIAFATFGVGGVLLWLMVFPLLQILGRDQMDRQMQARTVVGASFRLFLRWMRILGLIRYELHGLERLQRHGLLVLANHPTLIDVVFLIAYVPDASCVVKAGLARNFATRGPVSATGYICNNSGPDFLQQGVASVSQGANLVIFPEGTRTRPGQALQMQRGAAQVALRGGIAITPVHIHCNPLGLYKGQPWWQVAKQPLHFCIWVAEDIPTVPFLQGAGGEPALAARHLTAHLIDYFSCFQNSLRITHTPHASPTSRN